MKFGESFKFNKQEESPAQGKAEHLRRVKEAAMRRTARTFLKEAEVAR